MTDTTTRFSDKAIKQELAWWKKQCANMGAEFCTGHMVVQVFTDYLQLLTDNAALGARQKSIEARLIEALSELQQTKAAFSNHRNQAGYDIEKLKAELEQVKAALQSIAANTCCGSCQEAALVAKAALTAQARPEGA